MTKNKQLPFSRSWKNPKADLSTYSKIAVRPMATDKLRRLGRFTGSNFRNIGDTARKDAVKLAAYGAKKFETNLGESPNRRVAISTKASKAKGLMVLETNLVQVEPGRPAAQVINFFVPFVSVLNRPSIGVEGRFVDAATGETLFAFSDLERGEISLLDIQKFTYYGVQRRELNRWSKQLKKVVEGNGSCRVRDAFVVQPINW